MAYISVGVIKNKQLNIKESFEGKRQHLIEGCNSKRIFCFFWDKFRLLINQKISTYLFYVGCIYYLLESSVRLDDSWLYILEKADVHGLKIIYVELLHSNWSNRVLICIIVLIFFLYFRSKWRCHLLLNLDSLISFKNAICFSFYVNCELVYVAFLKEFTDELKLCFTPIL